jgi:hypothetical protein
MVFPSNSLVRLLGRDRQIVGAVYPRRHPPYDVMGRFDQGFKSGCVPAEYLPTGLLYTSIDVFSLINPPWFEEEHRWAERSPRNICGLVTEDVVFCQRAMAQGLQPYVDVDLSYEVVHLGEQYISIQREEIAEAAE